MAHRSELIDQAASTIVAHTGIKPGIIQGAKKASKSLIQVASLQTLLQRKDRLPPASLLVIDEAHHVVSPEWRALADHYSKAYHLLLSATPSRADGKPMGDVADAIVAPIQPSELIAQNSLVPCEIVAPSDRVSKGLAEDPVAAYLAFASGKRCIVFAQHKVQALALLERFNANDVPAVAVFDDTPWSVRQQAYAEVKSGKKRVLINIMIATEGFDLPEIEAVILARSVSHPALFIQMSARGSRPAPWINKQSYTLIDLKGSVTKFGSPDNDRTYSLDGDEGVTMSSGGLLKARTCGECGSSYTAVACPVCRAEYLSKEPEVEGIDLEKKRSMAPDDRSDLYQSYIRLLDRDWRADAGGFVKKAMDDFEATNGLVARPSWNKDFRDYLSKKYLTEPPPRRWPQDVGHPRLMGSFHKSYAEAVLWAGYTTS